jgi:hypothetical protein
VFHRSWRTATAALPLAGVLLAAGIAGPAFTGLGTAQGLAFLAVAVASIGLAVAVLRGARWAVATGAVLLGAQLGAVVGTIWELTGGIAASKADILRQLDVSPIAGLLVNLAYFDRVGGLRWPVRCGPRVGRRAGWGGACRGRWRPPGRCWRCWAPGWCSRGRPAAARAPTSSSKPANGGVGVLEPSECLVTIF